MTISELTLKSSIDIDEPVRRFEVFTGAGRRRDWSAEDKARIVAESFEPGAAVSAVARRHALSPQQLFTWRREIRNGLAPRNWRALLKEGGAFHGQAATPAREGIRGGGRSSG